MRDFKAEIEAILGSTGTLIPIGRPQDENAAATTVETRGGIVAVFTYGPGARTGWTKATSYRRNAHRLPSVPFNGTSEKLTSPDAAYWSRGNGLTDSPFSVGAWVQPSTAAAGAILAKRGATFATQAEWDFILLASGKIRLVLSDASAGVTPVLTGSRVIQVGELVFQVVTYDGTGGATAVNGAEAYYNGVLDSAPVRTNEAAYVAMEDLAYQVELGVFLGTSSYFQGEMLGGALGPFFTQIELTAQNVWDLYQIGAAAQRAQAERLRLRR